jgi:GTPase SAR1 family protein
MQRSGGCRPDRILLLGLDNAGKTTLLQHLKLKKKPTEPTIPTIGKQTPSIDCTHYIIPILAGHE